MRHFGIIVFVLVLVFGWAAGDFAPAYGFDENEEQPKIRVSIHVAGEDLLQARLSHCLVKNLRKFEDIEITDQDADWKLDIIAVRTPARGGTQQDYAFSLVVSSPDAQGRDIIRGHDLMVGYPNPQGGCKNIAIRFLERYLEKETDGVIDRYR